LKTSSNSSSETISDFLTEERIDRIAREEAIEQLYDCLKAYVKLVHSYILAAEAWIFKNYGINLTPTISHNFTDDGVEIYIKIQVSPETFRKVYEKAKKMYMEQKENARLRTKIRKKILARELLSETSHLMQMLEELSEGLGEGLGEEQEASAVSQ